MTNSSGQPVRLEDGDGAPVRFTAWLLCLWGWLACGLLTLVTWRLAPDGVYYVQMAESLAAGNGITAFGSAQLHYSPGYPLLVVPWIYLTDSGERASHCVGIFSTGLVLALAYHLGTTFIDGRARRHLAWLLGLHGWLCYQGTRVLSEAPYTLLLLVLLWMLIHVRQKQRLHLIWAVASGLLLAFMHLMRAEAGIFLPAILLVFLWKRPLSSGVASAVLVVTTFAAGAYPYWHFLHDALGRWTVSGKPLHVTEHAVSLQVIIGGYLLQWFHQIRKGLDILYFGIGPLLLLMGFIRGQVFRARLLLALIAIAALPLLVFPINVAHRRYLWPLLPIALVPIAAGTHWLRGYLHTRWLISARGAAGTVGALIVLLSCVPWYHVIRDLRDMDVSAAVRDAAGDYQLQSARVCAQEPFFAYYCNGVHVSLPKSRFHTVSDLVDYLQQRRAEYYLDIPVEDRVEQYFYLNELRSKPHESMVPEKQFTDPVRMVLYKVKSRE